eukprot:sb/3474064/
MIIRTLDLVSPIRTRYLGHVTGYQLIRDQYFLIRSVHVQNIIFPSSSDILPSSSSSFFSSSFLTNTYKNFEIIILWDIEVSLDIISVEYMLSWPCGVWPKSSLLLLLPLNVRHLRHLHHHRGLSRPDRLQGDPISVYLGIVE